MKNIPLSGSDTTLEAQTSAAQLWKTVHDSEQLALHSALYTWPAARIYPGWVLDLGSECGFGSLLISEQNPALRVMSMDLDAAALRYSRTISGKERIMQVRGEAHGLPVPTASFTGIFLIHVLHLVDDPEQVLHEVWRALKPGGLAVVAIPQCEAIATGQAVDQHSGALTSLLARYFPALSCPEEVCGQLPSLPPRVFRLDAQASAWLALCRK